MDRHVLNVFELEKYDDSSVFRKIIMSAQVELETENPGDTNMISKIDISKVHVRINEGLWIVAGARTDTNNVNMKLPQIANSLDIKVMENFPWKLSYVNYVNF